MPFGLRRRTTHLLGRIGHKLDHPYWGSGAFVAKAAVNLATIFWGLSAFGEDALMSDTFIFYMTMLWYLPASYWASGAILIGGFALWRLLALRPPIPWGACGYFGMAMFWGYLAISCYTIPLPAQPARTAAVTVIGILALYAFLTNPKRYGDPRK